MTIYIRLSRAILTETINQRSSDLKKLSLDIHAHPETAFEEVFAHSAISDLLESNGFEVTRGAYGVPTSFEAQVGTGGRLVIFCAEYDALPQIGHGCGHNLIAMSSIAGFIAAAEWLRQSGTPGRVRLLGCPAEESGGGKAKLIDAGAFKDDVAAAIMAHPVTEQSLFNGPSGGQSGLAGLKLNARHMFNTEFRGKAAHAAAEPWNGLNAFDAAVAAYNNVGLLRQQIEPTDRIHAIMEVGGTVANVIPDYTRMSWMVRSPTVERADQLLLRVKDCIRAGASAAGCELNYIE
ncbi:hypothetical protein F4777DRAFT_536341 [Nemania sp. FL0916]|nr:hypothetical protein F4777DRAFT_536341 [Nemania sp. FL0916]